MKQPVKYLSLFFAIVFFIFFSIDFLFAQPHWETLNVKGEPTARHEAGLVAYKNKLYLLGGRRINPTSVFDPASNSWTEKSRTPIELHHFQPVVYKDAIYMIGAMTGQWPNEKPLERIIIYYPEKDQFVYGDTIPEYRRRGGAGAVVYKDKIYLVGGITKGHLNGYKAWFDVYDPRTGEWQILPDAPDARDHFQAAVAKDKLYAFAGRTSSRITGEDMALTVSHGNIFDFNSRKWLPVINQTAIPTPRAGNFVLAWKNALIVGGGESMKQETAHNEVEVFNTENQTWSRWPSLNRGRHGTGFAIIGDYVYTASGCGKRGGEPELTSIERLKLSENLSTTQTKDIDERRVFKLWHTVTLDFEGPQTSEVDEVNPFTDYKLLVEFKHRETSKIIRGFYAADGKAAYTSAKAGSIWQVRFTPDKTGEWTYSAKLYQGKNIALADVSSLDQSFPLPEANGNFLVIRSDKEEEDFRSNGRLIASDGYFKFQNSNNYWLKGGTNSPENLLGYVDFDDTYRIKAEAREGEAAAPTEIHSYIPHLKDWKPGDPTWGKNQGKALIGGINYLASKGMNSAYFLTLNILGDGKDVWPYLSPEDFTRFDVSKLDQWEILFNHMQSKGILLHLVIQETENETLLDNGDTGPLRQLYFNELIARFGHHLALVWNLGEENGPASWTPIGQNDTQRKAMATYFKTHDPYNHPVLLHTHSEDPLRADILNDIVGYKDLDGLSLQQAEREEAPHVVETWRKKAAEAGHNWLITMDEIGKWHTGALPDSMDASHYTLRRYALWGTLLSGGAGVEWYFGAKAPQNDLTSEDWRQRDRLWEITNHAKTFFTEYLPFWEMKPSHDLVDKESQYCFAKEGQIYALYTPEGLNVQLDLSDIKGKFTVQWFNPRTGGSLQLGSVSEIEGGKISNLGLAPKEQVTNDSQDWVILVTRR